MDPDPFPRPGDVGVLRRRVLGEEQERIAAAGAAREIKQTKKIRFLFVCISLIFKNEHIYFII